MENDIYNLEHKPIDLNQARKEMRERIINAYSIISNPTYTNDERANALRSIIEKIVFDKESNQVNIYYHYL